MLSAWLLAGGVYADAQITPASPPAAVMASSPLLDDGESLPLAQDPTLRLTIAVTIDGRGPYDFLVDTGSDRTVISRELAAALKLPKGPDVVIHQSAGVDVAATVVITHLGIGSRVVDHIDAPALAAADLGAAGILGVDSLRDLHVVMDFKAMRLSSSPSRPEPFDGRAIVVHGHSSLGQLVLVDAEIRGVPVNVLLDSGSQVSVGNPALLRLLTGGDPRHAARGEGQIISVTGRRTTFELDKIADARIGGLLIRDMTLGFGQLQIFDHLGLARQPSLLLGMDVLSQCRRVSLDLQRREATFTLN